MLVYVQELSSSNVTYRATPTLGGSGSSTTMSGMDDLASEGGGGATASATGGLDSVSGAVETSLSSAATG